MISNLGYLGFIAWLDLSYSRKKPHCLRLTTTTTSILPYCVFERNECHNSHSTRSKFNILASRQLNKAFCQAVRGTNSRLANGGRWQHGETDLKMKGQWTETQARPCFIRHPPLSNPEMRLCYAI